MPRTARSVCAHGIQLSGEGGCGKSRPCSTATASPSRRVLSIGCSSAAASRDARSPEHAPKLPRTFALYLTYLYSPHQPRSPPSLRKIGTAIKLALIARSKQVDFKSIPIVSSRSNQWSALHIDCTLLGPRVSSLHTLRHLLISWLLGAPAHVNCEIFAHGFRSKCGGLG